MIITSVVPPELPMELSLAVNNSLIALTKFGVFCTEPFRIPLAGAVDVCCFDKTGTLTADEFQVRGVAGIGDGDQHVDDGHGPEPQAEPQAQLVSVKLLVRASAAWDASRWVLAACHSLVWVDALLVGDPVEKSALQAVEFVLSKSTLALAVAFSAAFHSSLLCMTSSYQTMWPATRPVSACAFSTAFPSPPSSSECPRWCPSRAMGSPRAYWLSAKVHPKRLPAAWNAFPRTTTAATSTSLCAAIAC